MMRRSIVPLIFLSIISLHPQAKYEPPSGAYIGAFIVNDPVVNGNVTQFETLTGKKHSSYFSYASYGQPFPSSWVSDYASKGNIVQIAFEPNNGLEEVKDGEYIREWARMARRSGAMIFLRWACEMNGSWVAWWGNPELYKEKFRLIHRIMKEEAPNVAIVWAPNDVPNDPLNPPNYIHAYYPGDEFVDWVGIDFYGVYYHTNGAPERKSPGEKLKIVYDVYSSRKPIIICEWAAAHYTNRVTPAVSCSTYCMEQMDSLYGIASVRFPRLKSINWFSMNSLSQNGCNFTLTENTAVLNHYKSRISDNYFRSQPFRNVPLVKIYNPAEDTVIRGNLNIKIKVSCDTQLDSTVIYLGPERIAQFVSDSLTWDFNSHLVQDGAYELKAIAYSTSGYSNFEKRRIIIDNNNLYYNTIIDDVVGNNFVLTGAWNISTSQPDRYGAYYHYSLAGDGSNKAYWSFNIPSPGTYNVYGFWSAHPNRASDAPYVITSAAGNDTVRVNQEVNGGKWNLLGRYYFLQGSNRIELNNLANEIVIADAVRVEWDFNLPAGLKVKGISPVSDLRASIYPNPIDRESKLYISGINNSSITISFYEVSGALLFTRRIEKTNNDFLTLSLSGDLLQNRFNQLPAGIYLLRIITGTGNINLKCVYLK